MKKVSKHYTYKRKRREKFIEKYLHGDGKPVDRFIIDRGHKNGVEIHELTDNGIIVIYNLVTAKVITKLIARPKQIKRYYNNIGKKPPRYLMNLAYKHSALGYYRI